MKAPFVPLPDSRWHSPPQTLCLGFNEVHVWQAALDQAPSDAERFLRSLAADERARAERFHFAQDREHFIAARGVLRAILGGYLQRPAESVSFCYGSRGKPALAGEAHGDAIRFNLSHSGGIVLYAVSRGRDVGIDVERIRSDLAVVEIAEQYFPRREAAMLGALPKAAQCEAFFRSWTRKEAYIKARGEGLSLPLDNLDASAPPAQPNEAADPRQAPYRASRWSLQELAPAVGYVAALAVEGQGWSLACWRWPNALCGSD